jgi:hypothetical protein
MGRSRERNIQGGLHRDNPSVAAANDPLAWQRPVVQMRKAGVVRGSQPKIVPLGQRKHFVSGPGPLLLAYTSGHRMATIPLLYTRFTSSCNLILDPTTKIPPLDVPPTSRYRPTTTMAEPTVSISISEYDLLRRAHQNAEERANDLANQLDAQKLIDPSGTINQFRTAFLAAVKVMQFAVGNLDPATVSGWPYEALSQVTDGIETLPGIDVYSRELPLAWRVFIESVSKFEAWRKQRDAERGVTMASPADFGPQTPEAKHAHAAALQSKEALIVGTVSTNTETVTVENGTSAR